MTISVHDAIDGAKGLIANNPGLWSKHTTFSPVYQWTNENVYNALDFAEIYDKKNALSVLASGDQTFSMLSMGIESIDTFDINALTEYYALGFKRAMILKYDYSTFLETMRMISTSSGITTKEIYEIIIGLFSYMESRHVYFWKKMIDYDWFLRKEGKARCNVIMALTHGIRDLYYVNDDIPYLSSKENYITTKKRLSDTDISFTTCDAAFIEDNFKGPYDMIYLSNVLDFFSETFGTNWQYEKLYEYEQKLKSLASKDASIVLKYVLNFFNKASIFKGASPNISDDFQDEEIYRFGNSRDNKDAIVLLRKL